jgi:hypothetical protein
MPLKMSKQLIKDSKAQLKKMNHKQLISLLSFYFSYNCSIYLSRSLKLVSFSLTLSVSQSLSLGGQQRVYIGLGV